MSPKTELYSLPTLENSYLVEAGVQGSSAPVKEQVDAVLKVHFERLADIFVNAPNLALADDERTHYLTDSRQKTTVLKESMAVTGAIHQLVATNMRVQHGYPIGQPQQYKESLNGKIDEIAHIKTRELIERVIDPQRQRMRLFTICGRIDEAIESGAEVRASDLEAFGILARSPQTPTSTREALANKYVVELVEKTAEGVEKLKSKASTPTELSSPQAPNADPDKQAGEILRTIKALGGPSAERPKQVVQLVELARQAATGKPIKTADLAALAESTANAKTVTNDPHAADWSKLHTTAVKAVGETLGRKYREPIIRENLIQVLDHAGYKIAGVKPAGAGRSSEASDPQIPTQQKTTPAAAPVVEQIPVQMTTTARARSRTDPASIELSSTDDHTVVALDDHRRGRGANAAKGGAALALTAAILGTGIATGASGASAAETTSPTPGTTPNVSLMSERQYERSLDPASATQEQTTTAGNTQTNTSPDSQNQTTTAPTHDNSSTADAPTTANGDTTPTSPTTSTHTAPATHNGDATSTPNTNTQPTPDQQPSSNTNTPDQPADPSTPTPNATNLPAGGHQNHDRNNVDPTASNSSNPTNPSDQPTDPTTAPSTDGTSTAPHDNGNHSNHDTNGNQPDQNGSDGQPAQHDNSGHDQTPDPVVPVDPSAAINQIVRHDDDAAKSVHGAAKHADITEETAPDGSDVLVINDPQLQPTASMPSTVLPDVTVTVEAPDVPPAATPDPNAPATEPNAPATDPTTSPEVQVGPQDASPNPTEPIQDGSIVTIAVPKHAASPHPADSPAVAQAAATQVSSEILTSSFNNPNIPVDSVADQEVNQLMVSGEQPVDRPDVEAKVQDMIGQIAMKGVADPAHATDARDLQVAALVGAQMPQTAPGTTAPTAYPGNEQAQMYKDALAQQAQQIVFGPDVPGASDYTSDQQAEIVGTIVNAETLTHSLDEIQQALIQAGLLQDPNAPASPAAGQPGVGGSHDKAAGKDNQHDQTDKAIKAIADLGDSYHNAAYAVDYIIKHSDLTPAQAIGLTGSFKVESGVDPTKQQYGGGPGYGIAQDEAGGRLNTLKRFAADRGLDYTKLDTQLAFTIYEFHHGESHAYELLKQTNTPEEAADVASRFYERPNPEYAHNDLREHFARIMFNVYTRAQKAGHTESLRGVFHTGSEHLAGADKVVEKAHEVTTFSQAELDNICQDGAHGACYRRCARLAARVWGRESAGYETAASQWDEMEKQGYAHEGDRRPPVGALLFYNTGKTAGHVAVFLGVDKDGNPMVLSNDVLDSITDHKGRAYIVNAKDLEGGRWNLLYEGWAPPVYHTAHVN